MNAKLSTRKFATRAANSPEERRRYCVFLSHGGLDDFVVSQSLGPMIRKAGADVFIDDGKVGYGEDFREKIFRELAVCNELLVLLTPASVKRPWVFAELGTAVFREVHVVAMRYGISELDLSELGILSLLGTRKLLPLRELDVKKYLEELRARVKGTPYV